MIATATDDVIKAAMRVAKDAAEGKISAAELDTELADTCRSLFGVVAGPDDPLWTLHIDIARQVLAAGGLSVDELAEWVAVMRRRSGAVEPTEAVEASGLSGDAPAGPGSPANGPLSPEAGHVETDREPEE